MNYLMLDTCVWLDVAVEHHECSALDVLQSLVKRKQVSLLCPRIVTTEFDRNEHGARQKTVERYKTWLKQTRHLLNAFPGDNDAAHRRIVEIEEALRLLDQDIQRNFKVARDLMNGEQAIHFRSESVVWKNALNRGINKQAPFHRNENAVADAIIIEEFSRMARQLRSQGARMIAFVTKNHKEFSDVNDRRKPHPDFANLFQSDGLVRYSLNCKRSIHHTW